LVRAGNSADKQFANGVCVTGTLLLRQAAGSVRACMHRRDRLAADEQPEDLTQGWLAYSSKKSSSTSSRPSMGTSAARGWQRQLLDVTSWAMLGNSLAWQRHTVQISHAA
jgi:hypothetical protein